MSKFYIESNAQGRKLIAPIGPGHDVAIPLSHTDIADLSALLASALCEMNTERMAAMAGHCRCDINPDYVNAICGLPYRNEHGNQRFCQNKMPDGESCAHNAECHAPPQGAKP